jgi:sortase B
VMRATQQEKPNRNLIFMVLMLFFTALFAISAYFLFQRVIRDSKSEADIKALESKITETIPEEKIPEAQTAGQAIGEVVGQATGKIVGQTVTDYRSRYQALLDENPDFIGWIRIPDTKVDLPVVWRKGDNAYYLKHGFDGQKSEYGVPFLDEKCDPDPKSTCNNYVIYGHHMKTGTVFAGLLKYENPDYLKQHPEITFNTIYEDGTYEIFGAFAVDVTRDKTFKYYEDTAMNEKDFNAFISEIKKRSVIKSDITPEYGDRILTLSTCEYSTNDGRFVVFGVKK